MTCLGNLYRYGKGRPTNANLAVDWYTKAAGCGEGTSMYNLSQMYLRGEGVKQDTWKHMRSYSWLAVPLHKLNEMPRR
jgi:TPR repeat protein